MPNRKSESMQKDGAYIVAFSLNQYGGDSGSPHKEEKVLHISHVLCYERNEW